MKPIIQGYLWDITFYPVYNGLRPVKQIFWYDSSEEHAFVNFTDGYEILVPEEQIQGDPEDIKWVRENLALLQARRQTVMHTDYQGNWTVVLNKK